MTAQTETEKFRDPKLAKQVSEHIKKIAPKYPVKFCHVCGTHEWTITHNGIRSLLPDTVEVIAGPGCPVCILPASDIDEAIALAKKGITITSFGDLIRVPGSETSHLFRRTPPTQSSPLYGFSKQGTEDRAGFHPRRKT